MSLPNIDDVYLEIIVHLPLNDIINLYMTNKYYHNIIKNIPQLEKTLKFIKKIPKIHSEYIILFIYEELFANNQYQLASKLINYVDTYYDLNNPNYDNFEEHVFQYFLGNEFVNKDNVNNFITMFDYSNVKRYINNILINKLKDNIEILFKVFKLLNHIDDTEIYKIVKLFWNNNQAKIKDKLRPTGFFGKPRSDKYYKKIDKTYNKLNDKYTK